MSISKYNLLSKKFFLYKSIDFGKRYVEKHHNMLEKYFINYGLGEYPLIGVSPFKIRIQQSQSIYFLFPQ